MLPQFTKLYDCKICDTVLFYNVHHHFFHWCVLTLCTAVSIAFPEWTCWWPVYTDIDWDLRFSQWCCLGCETVTGQTVLTFHRTVYASPSGSNSKSREYLLGLPDLMKAWW